MNIAMYDELIHTEDRDEYLNNMISVLTCVAAYIKKNLDDGCEIPEVAFTAAKMLCETYEACLLAPASVDDPCEKQVWSCYLEYLKAFADRKHTEFHLRRIIEKAGPLAKDLTIEFHNFYMKLASFKLSLEVEELRKAG